MRSSCSTRLVVLALCAAVLALLPVGHVSVRGQSGPRLYTTWRQPGGSIEGAQYSALRQINKSNVSRLELKWFSSSAGSRRALRVQPAGG